MVWYGYGTYCLLSTPLLLRTICELMKEIDVPKVPTPKITKLIKKELGELEHDSDGDVQYHTTHYIIPHHTT